MSDPVDLEVRPPVQRRATEAWERVLTAGVTILDEGGYDAFTIAAVCQAAGVHPPSIYARVSSKDALFIAVYEKEMQRIVARTLTDPAAWSPYALEVRLGRLVAALAEAFAEGEPFLRAVILRSGVDAGLRERGSRYTQDLGRHFREAVLDRRDEILRADAERAVDACFRLVFASLVMRVTHGPAFASPRPVTWEALTAEMTEAVVRYLMTP